MFFSKDMAVKILTALPLTVFLYMRYVFSAADYDCFGMLELFKMLMFGGGINRTKDNVLVCMRSMVPLMVLLFMYGTWIYNDLKISSIYAFTRNSNRKNWYFCKCLELLLSIGTFFVIYTVFILSVVCFIKKSAPDMETSVFFISAFSVLSLGSFLFALSVNLLAVLVGGKNAFIAGITFIICNITLSIKFEKLPVISSMPVLLRLNPLANMICSWKVNQAAYAILYFLILDLAIVMAGYRIVSGLDIGLILHDD